MSSYILCKILSFQARVAQEVFNTPGLHSFALACYELSIFRTDLFVAPSETEFPMLMRQIKKERFPYI